jgi:putative Holliday junction resolvase
MGLDLGARRIGVATSDSRGIIASPVDVIERSGDPELDLRRLAAMAEELGAAVVVVGLPLSMSGRTGPAAWAAEEEIEALREGRPLPVVAFDERLTTVEASRRRRERGGARRRGPIDAEAAAILLQAYLDREAGRG